MGIIQKDAFRTMLISYFGLTLGYLNKGVLFVFILSTEQIGLTNLLVSIGLLFAQFASLGVVNTTWKFFPYFRNEARRNYGFLKLIITIAIIGSLLTTGLAVFFKEAVASFYRENSTDFITYYYWIIPVGIANVFYLLFDNYLRGLYKNVFPAFVYEVLLRLIVTALLLALFYELISFEVFLIMNCLSFTVPAAILFFYLIKLGEIKNLNVKIQVPRRFKSIIIKYGLYSYTNSLGAMVVTTLDVAMIASMVGLSGAGVYSTIIYLTSALQIPYRSIVRVSIPFVSLYWKERKMLEMKELYRTTSGINIIIGGFLFLLVWVSRDEVFSLLPNDFQEGIYVFLYLMIGKMFDMYTGINSMILSTSKKYRIDILFTFILIGIVFGLNYVLIPIYGIKGAAISTMVALITYNVLRVGYVWIYFKIHPFHFKQFVVLALLGIAIVLGELFPVWAANRFVTIGLNSVLIFGLFIVPVLLLRLEPALGNYIRKFFGSKGVN